MSKKIEITGAEALMKSLVRENVEIIFGYPGGAIIPIYDALYDYTNKINHILVRHEQGAAHAAEGYSRTSGKVGVCMATSGPGATNLVTGITDAMSDSIPIVCITGQVSATALGTDAFQEAPVIGVVTPVTKWCFQITRPEEIPYAIAKAFHIAKSGRPGPVLIDITKNAQTDYFEYDPEEKFSIKTRSSIIPPINKDEMRRAANLINSAERPYLMFGHGVAISGAEKELIAFMEKSGMPSAATLLGLSCVPTNHPLYQGMLGMHGNYATNKLTNRADVILAIGMRFDDRVTGKVSGYAKQAKIIHVDIDQAELHKVVHTELAIHADAKIFLKEFISLVKKRTHSKWISEFKTLYSEEHNQVLHHELNPKQKDITMAEVISMLSEKTKGKAVIVSDVGQHQMVSARHYGFREKDSYITSGGLGTMGFALPAAIGAKFGNTKREVIAIIGDGSFQMNIQELGTIMQEDITVKIIILNNCYLGMVRQWQEMFFDRRYSFVEMHNPKFTKIAAAYGIKAKTVRKRRDLSGAINWFLKIKKSCLLNIFVRKEEKVFPMVPSGCSVDEIRIK